ncbi:MAG TPA: CBS domain-containing protein [Pseudolabrys sp.]|jgi:CBS domain-containing protein|nr:CBS domain-containing protein [Pseudolabrys sp.]
MNVSSILAAKGGDVITIEPTATLAVAAALLTKKRIGALVIVGAGGRVAGILSERDIVHALAERGRQALDEPLSQAMTREVATCEPDDEITSLMERMTDGKFRHMPVVKGDKLAGIVSIGDIVKQRVDEMERESEAMRGYIQTA